MNPEKRRELMAKASTTPPPPLHPPVMQQPQPQQPQQPQPQGFMPVVGGQAPEVAASKRGAVSQPGKVRAFGHREVNVQFVQDPQQGGAPVHVRGAQPVVSPHNGATVTMQGATRASGVRGARMVQGGQAPQMAPVQQQQQLPAPGQPWGGQAIPTAAPTPAVTPVVDLTVMLSQRARPMALERQLRALAAATVQPAAKACYINPVGVQLNDRLLQGIPTVRASQDMGPWMRWRFAEEASTKYVLVLDDDCAPGVNWIRLALERLERAEAVGEKIVVCAAGMRYEQDGHDSTYLVGPEAPHMDEAVVDVGRGAWMLRKDLLADILDYPRLGSSPATERVAVGLHIAAALQEVDHHIVVLPYKPNDKGSWGMCDAPTYEGSTTAMIDAQHKAGADLPSDWYRQDAYSKYRAAGWEPLCVISSGTTVKLSTDEFGSAPEQTTPVPAALSSSPAQPESSPAA